MPFAMAHASTGKRRFPKQRDEREPRSTDMTLNAGTLKPTVMQNAAPACSASYRISANAFADDVCERESMRA
jgi:hypothetical protein